MQMIQPDICRSGELDHYLADGGVTDLCNSCVFSERLDDVPQFVAAQRFPMLHSTTQVAVLLQALRKLHIAFTNPKPQVVKEPGYCLIFRRVHNKISNS